MYLSRLILNPRSRAVRRELADCQELHRTIMAGFPDVPSDGDARSQLGVLYRLDIHPRTVHPPCWCNPVYRRTGPDSSRTFSSKPLGSRPTRTRNRSKPRTGLFALAWS